MMILYSAIDFDGGSALSFADYDYQTEKTGKTYKYWCSLDNNDLIFYDIP